MEHVIAGKLNKQIAFDPRNGRAEHQDPSWTHDHKMGLESVADLVRIVENSGSAERRLTNRKLNLFVSNPQAFNQGIIDRGSAPPPLSLRNDSRKKVIAVLDDEAKMRLALARLLKTHGYDVAPFESGDDFLKAVESDRPDCMLLDLQHAPNNGVRCA